MSRRPYFNWYPADHQGDPRLRGCSPIARLVWREMLDLMHGAEPYGHLVSGGRAMDYQTLSRKIAVDAADVRRAVRELENEGVFSRTSDGVIYSRRMVRDEERRQTLQENGRKGGNPKLTPRKQNQRVSESLDNQGDSQRLKPQYPISIAKQAATIERAVDPPPVADDERADAAALTIVGEGKDRGRRSAHVDRAVDLHRWICYRLGAPSGYRGDLGTVVGWLEAGFDAECEVKVAIETVLSRDRGQLPTSLRYFEGAIRDQLVRGVRGTPRLGGGRKPPETRIDWTNLGADVWRSKLGLWARRVAKHQTVDQRDWPDWARWPIDDPAGPPPDRPGCRAPMDLVEEALGATGLDANSILGAAPRMVAGKRRTRTG